MSEVDGSIHDRLLTMDVPRIADEMHSALVDARSHPWLPIIEEYMRELAEVAFEAGEMQAEFTQSFNDHLAFCHGAPKAVMPEIAARGCSFIENEAADAAGEGMGVAGDVERGL